MSRYRFVEAESSRYPVAQVCRIAQVSRTAYYAWQDGQPSQLPSRRRRTTPSPATSPATAPCC